MITGQRNTVKLARKLRSEMTLPEVTLWRELRKRPGGFKFRRQHPAGPFILDFYCASLRLAIEADGAARDNAAASLKDKRRSAWLRSHGIATTRIPVRVILEDLDAVVERIVQIGRERGIAMADDRCSPLHQPAAGPPPRAGED